MNQTCIYSVYFCFFGDFIPEIPELTIARSVDSAIPVALFS